MTMYERIKQLRIEKGLSQQELANLTGYQDRSSIAKIESGVVDLPQSKILLFANVLGVSPAALMGLADDAHVFAGKADQRTMELSSHEREVVIAYRSHPELQAAVDRVLLLEPEAQPQPKQA